MSVFEFDAQEDFVVLAGGISGINEDGNLVTFSFYDHDMGGFMHEGYSSWVSYICHSCNDAYRIYLPSCSCCGSGSVSLVKENCPWCDSEDTEKVTDDVARAHAKQFA